MTAKQRTDYRKQKRAEQAAQISALDVEMLDLMGRLRRFTCGAELGDGPRCEAERALMKAIDDVAAIVTGDAEYFHAKHHSLAQGPRGG